MTRPTSVTWSHYNLGDCGHFTGHEPGKRKVSKVGRSKPPPVLTGSNRRGQYAKKWSMLVNTNLSGRFKILSGRFSGGLRNYKAADISRLKLRFL